MPSADMDLDWPEGNDGLGTGPAVASEGRESCGQGGTSVYSVYEEMFGIARAGRPVADEEVGMGGRERQGDPSGVPRNVLEQARRRANRVLRARHADEFVELMVSEVGWLQSKENRSEGAE